MSLLHKDVKDRVVWGLVLLVGVYVMCQLIADVAAVKLVSMFGVVIPAGTFIYAVTFTVRDVLHRRYGVEVAKAAIVAAAIANILMISYFLFAIALPYPPFWELQDAFAAVVGVVPGIVIGSILAEFVSEMFDTVLYQKAWDTFAPKSHLIRILFSNLFSVPVDSIVFVGVAFMLWPVLSQAGSGMSVQAAMNTVIGQTIFKWVISFIIIPLTYMNGAEHAPVS
jgi:hypothetical protein